MLSIFCTRATNLSSDGDPNGDTSNDDMSTSADEGSHDGFDQPGEADRLHNGIPPFVTPFGPSVLQCGFSLCAAKFYSGDQASSAIDVENVRRMRASYLKSIWGNPDTGLPERTAAPHPPSSSHYNSHISIAKVWSRITPSQRGNVTDGDGDAIWGFVEATGKETCTEQRGNIYSADMGADVRAVLPSFVEVVRLASQRLGIRVVEFEHDWRENTLEKKIAYEVGLMEWGLTNG